MCQYRSPKRARARSAISWHEKIDIKADKDKGIKADKQRTRETFKYTVEHTRKQAVGPLDFCGVARRLKGAGGKSV